MVIKDYRELLSAISGIGERYNLDIYHFGSRVWGNPRENSDVDILLDGDTTSMSKALFDIKEIMTLFKIDISTSDYVDKDIYRKVIKDGIRL